MTELEQLRQQRKEIDRKIKALQSKFNADSHGYPGVCVFSARGGDGTEFTFSIGGRSVWVKEGMPDMRRRLKVLYANMGELLEKMDVEVM